MVTAVGITTDEEDEKEKLLKAEGKNTEDEETWKSGQQSLVAHNVAY